MPGFKCHCHKRQQEGERSGRQVVDNGWALWMALQGGAAGGDGRAERRREPMWEPRLFPLEGIKAFHLLLKVIGLQRVRDLKGWKRKEQLSFWQSAAVEGPIWTILGCFLGQFSKFNSFRYCVLNSGSQSTRLELLTNRHHCSTKYADCITFMRACMEGAVKPRVHPYSSRWKCMVLRSNSGMQYKWNVAIGYDVLVLLVRLVLV